MLPLRDHNPTTSTAYVTIILIALNIAVFLTEPVLSSGRSEREQAVATIKYFACKGAVPYEVTHGKRISEELREDGGNLVFPPDPEGSAFAVAERIACPRKSVWFSILSSMFLHGSLLHLAGNMLFLWVFGNNVEDRLGRIKYVFFYLLSGLAAAFAQSFVFPSSATPLVGASGAIAGILGAYIIMFPTARIVTVVFFFLTEVPAFVMIGVWFLLQLLSSVGSVSGGTGVAYMAHVGGFLAGMLLLLVLRPRRPRPVIPLPG